MAGLSPHLLRRPATRLSRALTETKREILAALARFHCLDTKLAMEVLPLSERMVQRHMQELAALGIVTSIPYYPRGRRKGSPNMAYGLSRSGVGKAEALGIDTDATKTIDEHSPHFLPHTLGITRYHVNLEKRCDAHGWRLTWRQRCLKYTRKIERAGRKVVMGVHPDSLFRIEAPGHPDFIAFYEHERANLGHQDEDGLYDVTRKAIRYDDYYDSDDCEHDWGFRTAPTVIEMRTRRRAAALTEHLLKHGLKRAYFLITSQESPFEYLTPETGHSPGLETLVRR